MKHKFITGCRRLVRLTEPGAIDATEYVKGDNWHAERVITGNSRPEVPEREERDVICSIHLPELDNVYAGGVLVTVHLHWGGIARVELMDETRFFSKDRRVQLILPEGLDVLEGMSLDSKLELRKELGL